MGGFVQLLLGAILLYAVATGRAGKVFTAATGLAVPQILPTQGSGQGTTDPPAAQHPIVRHADGTCWQEWSDATGYHSIQTTCPPQ